MAEPENMVHLPPAARVAPPGAAVPPNAEVLVPDKGHGTIWRPPCPDDCPCFLHEGNNGYESAAPA